MPMERFFKGGTFQDEAYFELPANEKDFGDKVVEEVCILTRFLSLSCNKIHSRSKQELRNNMVKGGNKYPQIIVSTLHFLQYHTLCNSGFDHRNKSQEHTLA